MKRLIDAEYALATSISGLIRTIEGEPWIRVKEVRDSLKNVPTFDIDNIIAEHENIGYEKGFRDGYAEAVDAEPVKHGKWLMNDVYGAYCSECGSAAFEITGSQYSRMKTRYCWQCGARMEEQKDEAY